MALTPNTEATQGATMSYTDPTRATLHAFILWAESKCPCRDETPDPCTLCGASVASGTCKAADATLPPLLLEQARLALAQPTTSADLPSTSVGVPEGWRLVPKVPTPEMVAAGEAQFKSYCLRHVNGAIPTFESMLAAASSLAAAPSQAVEPIPGTVAEWRAFARHCQRLVGVIKTMMTAEQVVEFLHGELDNKIKRLASQDTADIDPELLALVREIFPESAKDPS